MAAPYFENTALTGINDLIDELVSQLTTPTASNPGWPQTTINGATGVAATSRVARQELFEAPGDGVEQAGGVFIDIARATDNGLNDVVFLNVYTGRRIVPVSSITRTNPSFTVTVNTVSPHGLTTGDVGYYNGSSVTDALHEGVPGPANGANTITVTGPSTFTYTSDSNANATEADGFFVAMYNPAGGLAITTSDGYRINVLDAAMDVFGYVDGFRICGIVQQGGNNQVFYLGQTGRGHVQSAASSVGIGTTAITGVGSETVTLDRSVSNLYVGQQIWAVSRNSADVAVTVVDGLPAANQVAATWGTAFDANEVTIGWDPSPGIVIARRLVSFTTIDLSSENNQFCIALDGTRNLVANEDFEDTALRYDIETPEGAAETLASNPNKDGAYLGKNIHLIDSTAEVRKPLPGWAAWPTGAQNEFDLQRTGGVPITDDFKVFTSHPVDSNFSLGIGPGATP